MITNNKIVRNSKKNISERLNLNTYYVSYNDCIEWLKDKNTRFIVSTVTQRNKNYIIMRFPSNNKYVKKEGLLLVSLGDFDNGELLECNKMKKNENESDNGLTWVIRVDSVDNKNDHEMLKLIEKKKIETLKDVLREWIDLIKKTAIKLYNNVNEDKVYDSEDFISTISSNIHPDKQYLKLIQCYRIAAIKKVLNRDDNSFTKSVYYKYDPSTLGDADPDDFVNKYGIRGRVYKSKYFKSNDGKISHYGIVINLWDKKIFTTPNGVIVKVFEKNTKPDDEDIIAYNAKQKYSKFMIPGKNHELIEDFCENKVQGTLNMTMGKYTFNGINNSNKHIFCEVNATIREFYSSFSNLYVKSNIINTKHTELSELDNEALAKKLQKAKGGRTFMKVSESNDQNEDFSDETENPNFSKFNNMNTEYDEKTDEYAVNFNKGKKRERPPGLVEEQEEDSNRYQKKVKYDGDY